MDFELNADQEAIVAGVQAILQPHLDMPQAERMGYSNFSPTLQAALQSGGFLDIIAEGLSPLDAALVTLEVAKCPTLAEVGASALIWPMVSERKLEGPVALIEGDPGKAVRLLPVARHALLFTSDDLIIADIPEGAVDPVETVLAYPFGKLRDPSIFESGTRLGPRARATARQWWRVVLALEYAGAVRSAIDFTVDYVKERHVFGRPIGSFQAVHHRLAQCHQIARAIHYLALFAAWKGDAESANIAAAYAQRHTGKIAFDLHQFNGGMGVTNEHLLHFWTQRIRALQAELGGSVAAALDIADELWPEENLAPAA
jgi:Acyl-CoA dehydrogenase, C-terminal domain